MFSLLSLFTPILLIGSFLGYFFLAKEKLSLKQEFIPIFVFSSITYIVYFCGLSGQLFLGSIIVMAIGLLVLAFILTRRLLKGPRFQISISLFQIVFLVGSLFFFALLFQCKLTHYDNFSHWAIVLKQILSTDAFPNASSDLIDFKNYPLGVTSFLYYVCRFAGNTQPIMLIAQGLLIFSCFYAMFGIISEKKRFLLYAFLGLGLASLSLFNITIRISNLLVDFLLPIVTLAIFTVVYHYRNDLKRACILVLPLAGLLTVIKSTGIIFAGLGLAFLCYTWLVQKERFSWKSSLSLVALLCGTLLPHLAWKWHMATFFQGVENKFDFSASNLSNMQMGKTPEQIHEIIHSFLKASSDFSTRPALGILIFNLLVILASIFASKILKKKWKLWKVLISLDVVLILYYLGILGLYLYSMPLGEALWLAGFERYASSTVALFVGGLVLCATVDLENSFYYRIGEVPDYQAFKNVKNKIRYQQSIVACMAIATILLMSEYNGIHSIANGYQGTLPQKVCSITGDRWYENGLADQKRYLFYASDAEQQVTNYYLQYVGRYFLYAPNVDGICLFYEDNMDNLLSKYDYLVIVEKDVAESYLLKKHYGVTGQEGIYKIFKHDQTVKLSLVGDAAT